VEVIRRNGSKAIRLTGLSEIPADRSEFEISQIFVFRASLQIANQEGQVVLGVAQGLTMIGERQRHQPASGNPAMDSAENHSIAQLIGGRGGRKNNRLVCVSPPQRIQPAYTVKHG
jgi:hypothetical protein